MTPVSDRPDGDGAPAAGVPSGEMIARARQACLARSARCSDHLHFVEMLAKAGRLDEAGAACRAMSARFAGHYEAHMRAGAQFVAADDEDEAIVYFARALLCDDQRDDARDELASLGVAGMQQLDVHAMRSALLSLDGAARTLSVIEKWRTWPVLRRARAMRRRKNWAGVIAGYERLLTRCPDHVPALTQLGHALRETGRIEAAVTLYRRAILLTPRDYDIYLHLGHALTSLDRRDAARYAYLTAYMLNPSFDGAARELRAVPGVIGGQVHRDMARAFRAITGRGDIDEGVSGRGVRIASGATGALFAATDRAFPEADGMRLIAQYLTGAMALRDS